MNVSYVRSQGFVVLEVSLAEVAVEFGVEPLLDDLVDLDPDVVPFDVSEGPVLNGEPAATASTHEGSLLTVTLGDVRKYHFLGLVVKLAISVTRTEVTLPHSPVSIVRLLYPIENFVKKLGVTVNQIIQRKTVDFFRRTVPKDFSQFTHTGVSHQLFTSLGIFELLVRIDLFLNVDIYLFSD